MLHGCETWSLTLREEHRLRVFENRILRRIFGSNCKRDEVTGKWRNLHNEEIHILYCSPNIIKHIRSRRMRWAGHVARMGKMRYTCKVFMHYIGIRHSKIDKLSPTQAFRIRDTEIYNIYMLLCGDCAPNK
jgi:hypothetical protein